MYKKLSALFMLLAVLAIPAVASAHVIVTPAQVGIGDDQTFQTAVPNEKDIPVTGLKLIIPAGLNEVSPNVKPGWNIQVVKSGDTVTEIDWTGGSVPAGQRDEFVFGAQTPSKATSLNWKAYQTYADGSVVAWDQNPTGKDDDSATPYSVTKVVNDLTTTPAATTTTGSNSNNMLGIVFGLVAIVISVGGLLFRKKS